MLFGNNEPYAYHNISQIKSVRFCENGHANFMSKQFEYTYD
jgi:hypothetical protein